MEKLPISVIIVAKNAEATIAECMSAVQKNKPFEIIVIDGNSTDRTIEISRRYTERIYSDEGKGLGYARQLGAEMANQEYIAYVDSHVILLGETALATMFTDFKNSDCVGINAKIAPNMKCSDYWEWGQYQHDLYSQFHGHRKNYFSTMAGLIRREIILKYGFNLSPKVHIDDLDMEFRLRRKGYRFGISSALFHNHYRTGFKWLFSHRFNHYGRPAAYYVHNWGIWHAYLWPPLVMLYWIGFSFLNGKPNLVPYFVTNGVSQTLGMLKGFVEILWESLRKSSSN
jgi:glycosyltransferase involved in cell wall biosynthesis